MNGFLKAPAMVPKLSQGVTTVIAGNCGISASPVTLRGDLPDPMNLLGDKTIMIMGGHGVISVASNLLPQDISAMIAAALKGDAPAARAQRKRNR